MDRKHIEDFVSARSYQIWEREGRLVGHDREIWERARAEIEAELHAAREGKVAGVVPPRPQVSARPVRHDA
jgi:hypothetical protein